MSTLGHQQIEHVSDRVTMRSEGQQHRSRERVENLLSAAQSIIAESGLQGLKMRELARRAALPIASVYHYFPSSSSVIRALAIRHLDELNIFVKSRVEAVMSVPTPEQERPQVAGQVVRDVTKYLLRSPATAPIWDGLKANPELRALDIEDTERMAQWLQAYIAYVAPAAVNANLANLAIVLVEAIQSNFLLIMQSPLEDQAGRIDALEAFAVAAFVGLQGGVRTHAG